EVLEARRIELAPPPPNLHDRRDRYDGQGGDDGDCRMRERDSDNCPTVCYHIQWRLICSEKVGCANGIVSPRDFLEVSNAIYPSKDILNHRGLRQRNVSRRDWYGEQRCVHNYPN